MRAKLEAFIEGADEDELSLLLSLLERRLGRRARASSALLEEAELEGDVLGAEQLERFSRAFAEWRAAARSPAQERSRGRLWLIFILIRHGGLRLGEALALDERDCAADNGALRVGGAYARTVPMPEEALRDMARLLEDPVFYGLRGQVTRVDPGYVRRVFYAVGKLCGLPAAVINPRALRRSRGLELLRSGVSPRAVDFFLGLVEEDYKGRPGRRPTELARRIVEQYLDKEARMKSSARNVFTGKVTSIVKDKLLAEVELETLSGLRLTAVITEESLCALDLAPGRVATATVKAPQVLLALPGQGLKVSARNAFAGRVTAVRRSEIAAEALADLEGGGKACALITADSADKLGLAPGVEVLVMFKAFSVVLSVE